jgi:hypothetical protein
LTDSAGTLIQADFGISCNDYDYSVNPSIVQVDAIPMIDVSVTAYILIGEINFATSTIN